MAKTITEVSINVETGSVSINTKELIIGEQYSYESAEATLSPADQTALMAIITPYLTA